MRISFRRCPSRGPAAAAAAGESKIAGRMRISAVRRSLGSSVRGIYWKSLDVATAATAAAAGRCCFYRIDAGRHVMINHARVSCCWTRMVFRMAASSSWRHVVQLGLGMVLQFRWVSLDVHGRRRRLMDGNLEKKDDVTFALTFFFFPQ